MQLAAANPVPDEAVRDVVPEDWHAGVLTSITATEAREPKPSPARRSRPSRRGRALALAMVCLVTVAVAAPAVGLQRHIVDFLMADLAPAPVQLEFGQLAAGPTGAGAPVALPSQARKVIEAKLQGRELTLWAAPTKNGGFCWALPDLLSACSRRDAPVAVRSVETPGDSGLIGGHVLDRATERLQLRYEDGDEAEVPIAWVSAPISAGLFVVEVPQEHLVQGHRAALLTAYDAAGEPVAEHRFANSDPALETAADGLPRAADRSQIRTVIDAHGSSGTRRTLVVAPATDGRICYAYRAGSGCVERRRTGSALDLGIQNTGTAVLLFGTTGGDIANIELRFRDGSRNRLLPAAGFVLVEIPEKHHPARRRLHTIVGYDVEGSEITRKTIPSAVGIYPCRDGKTRRAGPAGCR